MRHSKIVLTLLVAAAAVTLLAQGRGGAQRTAQKFTVFETSIPELQAALKDGRTTSKELVIQYLTRIALYEDKVNATLTVNPAIAEAEQLDRERSGQTARPPTEFRSR
jgi:hypothetical protein